MGLTMTTPVHPAVTAVFERLSDRPPILEATRALGLNDRRVARLLGLTSEQINSWVSGKRPIPHRHMLASIFLIKRLTGEVGGWRPARTRYARRARIAVDAANAYAKLAVEELREDYDDRWPAVDIEAGAEIGQRMLDRLEARDAS
jgi:transcriptional regulator with XRE-family HTH domain